MSANWLYSAKKQNDLIFQVIELEQKWQEEFSLEQVIKTLDSYVAAIKQFKNNDGSSEHLFEVLDYLYEDMAFSGPGLQMLPESSLSNLSYCVMHRTGNPLTLSVLVQYLLEQAGFEAVLAESSVGLVLSVKLSNSELCVVDVMTGGTEYLISSDDVKETLTNEVASFAQSVDQESLLKEVITEQKIACLEEGFLHEALLVVETLMELLPEDPYERRDRGLVLNQLDCGKWAKEDFDYFIKACPNDPMALFIRSEIEEQVIAHQTIH